MVCSGERISRHYWSQANYLQYYTLNNEGHLDPSSYWRNHNINFNAFTVDLQFVWYFAPGSELSVVMIDSPQTNSFSFSVLYYLDYLYIKKAFSKKMKK